MNRPTSLSWIAQAIPAATWLVLSVSAVAMAQAPAEPGRNIVVTPKPDARFDAGRKWAVLVGVNRYLDPSVVDLKYCVKDVRLMEQVLSQYCGYDKDRILVIADDQDKDHLVPLRINLDHQVRNWLKQAQAGDTVLVFFSGHGFLDERGQGFLAPRDCEKANLGLTGFRTDALRDMLRQCKATQKLLVLDCCYAGGQKGDEMATSSEELMSASFAKAEGLITLASCKRLEKSQEWEAKGNGLFTYYLALGLKGQADRDGNGIVDSDELYRFTSDQVPRAAQLELNSVQTPVRLIGEDMVGVFGLARVARRPQPVMRAQEVTVVFEVREEVAEGKRGPLADNALVDLVYRASDTAKLQKLASGRTTANGVANLKASVTVAQQVRGEFLAIVSRGEQTRVWRLADFPEVRAWNLTIPAAASPSPPSPPPSAGFAGTRAGQEWSGNGLKMAFCWCPPGQFRMGSPASEQDRSSDEAQVSVTLSRGFWLGKCEVTQGQWQQLMGTTPWEDKTYVKSSPDNAASYISWDESVAFCQKLTAQERSAGRLASGWEYTLPTEAQWEYGCRAGTTTAYSFGDDASQLGEYAWFDKNADDIGEAYAHAVGRKRANAWGLQDMHGNVWEWCRDWYGEKLPGGTDREVTTSASNRVIRGGCGSDDAMFCRSADRNRFSPGLRLSDLGFRVVAVQSAGK